MGLNNLTPDSYQEIILTLTAERTIVVKGVAGSGKSLLLLWKARQVSTFTKSYAIIVYTKSLKRFFVEELSEIDPTGKHVFYFAEWERSRKYSYTYLFVDECQDFSKEEIDDFRKHGTYCWFFGDTDQSIMKFKDHDVQSVEDTAIQLGVHTQDLAKNHRLTVENAKVGEFIKPETRLSFACYKHGPKPSLIHKNTQLEQLDEMVKLYQNDIVNLGILVYYIEDVKIVRDYFAEKGVPVAYKTRDEMEIDFKTTNPIVMTFHCAKGLQFHTTFIPFCDKYSRDDEKAALYVASTRPLVKMYLLYSGNCYSNKFLLPPLGSTIYDNPNEREESEGLPF